MLQENFQTSPAPNWGKSYGNGQLVNCAQPNTEPVCIDTHKTVNGSHALMFDLNLSSNGQQVPGWCQQNGPNFGGQQCGGFVEYMFSDRTELWERYRVFLDSDFVVGDAFGTKIMHLSTNQGYSDWLDIDFANGSLFYSFTLQLPYLPAETAYVIKGGAPAKNQWVCIEVHRKIVSPGVGNDILELFSDGQPVFSRSDVEFRDPSHTRGFNMTRMVRQDGAGKFYLADYRSDDSTRVGCGGAIPVDQVPPGAPAGLMAQ